MTASTTTPVSPSEDHALFLSVMPVICALARRRFANLPLALRDDAVAEAVATGFLSYLSLRRRGRIEQVATAGFVRNAVRAVAGGRRVGSSQAGMDVMSRLGRRRHGRCVASLDGIGDDEDASRANWLHEAVADRRTAVPEQVAVRIDGGRWLTSLSNRDRQLVQALAAGEKACHVARRFAISPGRLSQLRQAWSRQWQQCVGIAA
ncbi:hypothetical protein ACERK3_16210 [Phycisphaerales bacterium AB-hyl4]|uniref:Sigma-70 family RNA polymerase sigma factor n=1 Tax=Natronomicrosphaera hydrolytica TaxID=3242702 RepID=A0ABV4UBN8_9BACT